MNKRLKLDLQFVDELVLGGWKLSADCHALAPGLEALDET